MKNRVHFFVLLNIAVSFGCPPSSRPRCPSQEPIGYFFELVARKVISADSKAQELCNRQGSTVLEVHTKQEYKLIVPGAGSASYEIKVRDRVVQIVPDSCQNSLAEVKILPTYVNGYGGRYYSYKGNLEVAFPYSFNLTSGGRNCKTPNRIAVSLDKGACVDCLSRW